jgi:hypothetical protein
VRGKCTDERRIDGTWSIEAQVPLSTTSSRERRVEERDGKCVVRRGDARDVEVVWRGVGRAARGNSPRPRDRRVADVRIERVSGIRLEHLCREHDGRAATQLPSDVGEALEQRTPRTTRARLRRHDERAHLAREGGRVVDAVPFEPPLDLTDRSTTAVGDEVNVTSEDRLSAAHARVFGEPVRELLVHALIARARVAAPRLVSIPELTPETGDGPTFVRVRRADGDGGRLHHGGHGSPAPSGSVASMCISVRP